MFGPDDAKRGAELLRQKELTARALAHAISTKLAELPELIKTGDAEHALGMIREISSEWQSYETEYTKRAFEVRRGILSLLKVSTTLMEQMQKLIKKFQGEESALLEEAVRSYQRAQDEFVLGLISDIDPEVKN